VDAAGIAWYASNMSEFTTAPIYCPSRKAAGVIAGSISLVGFGMDSFIEVTSGATLLWRMSVDADVEGGERNEKLSLRIVGTCFIALAVCIAYKAVSDLIRKTATSPFCRDSFISTLNDME
jgi:hypothetical protein